jgi:hypothetical protein
MWWLVAAAGIFVALILAMGFSNYQASSHLRKRRKRLPRRRAEEIRTPGFFAGFWAAGGDGDGFDSGPDAGFDGGGGGGDGGGDGGGAC